MDKWSGKHFFSLILISGTDNPWHSGQFSFSGLFYHVNEIWRDSLGFVSTCEVVAQILHTADWMGGSHDPNQVCSWHRVDSEQAGPGLGVEMLRAVSAKGTRGRLGGNLLEAEEGRGRAGRGWTGTAFLGSELPGGRGERRAGSGSSKAAPEVIKLEK